MSALWASTARDRWLWIGLACAALVCLPLLFIAPGADWYNHVWMVDYHARYLTAHGWFPSMLNSYQVVGMAFPVFYGYLFFPLLALFSTILSGNLTLRILSVLLLFVQFILVYQTTRQWTGNRFFAFTLGTLLTWSIYPLTNLYNRGAIPEFFACGLLTCACVALMQALRGNSVQQLWLWSNFSVLCLCGCAGTHPITALYGLLFYAILVGIGMTLRGRKHIARIALALLVPGLIATVSLAPWVVSTARYNKQLDIAYSFREVSYWPKSIDGLHLRLCPIPVPIYNLRHKAADEHMGTPGLDAQINMPILLLFLIVVFSLSRQGRLQPKLRFSLIGLSALAVWLTYMSSTQHALDKLGYYAGTIQFAYRLVTYINLAVFSGILLAISQSSSTSSPESTSAHQYAPQKALLVLLAIGLLAMGFKLYATKKLDRFGNAIFANQITDKQLLQLSLGFYGHQNYAVPSLLPLKADLKGKNLDYIQLLPAEGKDFGQVQPAVSTSVHRGWSFTNVQVFPWNVLSFNDQILPNQTAAAFRPVKIVLSRPLPDARCICIKDLGAGVLKYSFKPEADWAILNAIALPIFLFWSIGTAVVAVFVSVVKTRGHGADKPAPVLSQQATPASN